uniref:C-type lectin domain-containing protein n=1 Tax=Tetraodon nigroviridis TaxID=99883 RepID=H3C0L1_TETNG
MAETHDQTLREILDQQRDFSNLTTESEESIDHMTETISFTTHMLGSINLKLNELRTSSETVSRHSDFLLSLNNSMTDVQTDAASLRAQQEELASRLGCPLEWLNYRDKCYFFSKDLHSFDDAKTTCDSLSASLLVINDKEEQKWLRKQVQGKGYFWIGLTDKEEENVWRWLDGTQPAFTMWKPGQPDNWGHGHDISGEDCAGLVHEALWNDFFCEDLISYICEKEPERCE